MITSVVVMSGVTEAKCSNCCEWNIGGGGVAVVSGVKEEKCSNWFEFTIGCKATSGRCCEWSIGREVK